MARRHRHGPTALLLLLAAACTQEGGRAIATGCRSVAVYDELGTRVTGIEDMAVDHVRGLVYLSAYDRRAVARERKTEAGPVTTGGLYAMAVSPGRRPDGDVRRLHIPEQAAIRPHGLALRTRSDGHSHLHVIDRRYRQRHGGWIETPHHLAIGLDETGLRVRHATSATFPPDLCNPNDLAASDDALFVTNDHGACGGAGRMLEDILALSDAFVARLEGGTAAHVAGDLAFANGITVDEAGGMLTVAETRAAAVSRIALMQDGDRGRIDLPGAPDNITRAADSSLIVATHPDLLRFAAFRAGWPGARHAPSRVIRLRFDVDGDATVTRLFDDFRGSLVSGATVAAETGGWLLIAGGYSDRMAVCRVAEKGA